MDRIDAAPSSDIEPSVTRPARSQSHAEPIGQTTSRPERGKADPAGPGAVTRNDVPPRHRRHIILYGAIPILALLGWGAWHHWRTHAAAAEAQRSQQDFTPEVRTAKAKRTDKPVELVEPGQTVAFDTANLFARATGFVAERRVDIGSRVRKGDLLFRIAAPDLDAQLVQAQAQVGQLQASLIEARANLQQAAATRKFADVTKFRTTTLAGQGWETRQNADQSTANATTGEAGVTTAQAGIAVANANLKAQAATVQRLQELIGFEQVTAPFDGVVTARNVDVGDLLSADNGSGTPIMTLQRDDVLRVAVFVPQSGAVGIRDGLDAHITVPELPGRTFSAKVSRTARALDQTSRSMLTEVDVQNLDGTLRAGLYADVTIDIPRQRPGIIVPDVALVFNAGGLQVAVLGDDDRVHYRKVSIYRDFGTEVELRDGLDGTETLVLTPPPNLEDGGKVRVAAPAKDDKA